VEGAPAPDFTLPSTSGGSVTLSELRGRSVLLAFFPAAFTRVCTEEMCALSEDFERFSGAGAVVLPISVDNVPSLREFKAKEGLQLDLLSDLRREVSRSFGVLDEERFVARRAYLLVDRAGVVRWRFIEETPRTKRDTAELLRRIEELN
jgi:peroxiredoxin